MQLQIDIFPVKGIPVSALTLLKEQISATPPGTIVAASVTWRRIQMFRLNSTMHYFQNVIHMISTV